MAPATAAAAPGILAQAVAPVLLLLLLLGGHLGLLGPQVAERGLEL